MPLASVFGHHWYGPGLASMIVRAEASDLKLAAKADGRAGARLVADLTPVKARGVPLRRANMTSSAHLQPVLARPRANGRARMFLGSTALSAPDVTGAVLEAEVEPGLTLKQALRLLAAAIAGKSSVAGEVVTFRNTGDTKDRLVVTVSGAGAGRTAVTSDLSDG